MHIPATKEMKKLIEGNISIGKKTLSEIERKYSDIGMTTGKIVLPAYLSVNFLSEAQYEMVRKYSESFARILNKIAIYYSNKEDLKRLFNLSDTEYGLFRKRPGCDIYNLISRYDMFFDGNNLKLIEFNCESPSGIGRIALIEDIYFDIPQLDSFRKRIIRHVDILEELLHSFIRTYRRSGGKKERPAIAFVDWKDVSTFADQEFIIDYFNSKGFHAFSCDPCSLEYSAGILYHGRTEIDIVFKRVIAEELFRKEDECSGFIEALKDDKIFVINPCMSILLNDKRILHYLSNGSFDPILDDDEIKVIREIIPWSREIRRRMIHDPQGDKVDLVEFILQNRQRLVMKPGKGYGGQEVVIGSQVSEDIWEKTLDTALAEQDWIVQEYVEIPTIDVFEGSGFVRKYINLSPFVIDGKLSGFFTRVSDSRIININRGGSIIPTFVIKD